MTVAAKSIPAVQAPAVEVPEVEAPEVEKYVALKTPGFDARFPNQNQVKPS